MANTDREPGAEPRPNDTPELEDELRSIRATGEGAHGADSEPHEKVDRE